MVSECEIIPDVGALATYGNILSNFESMINDAKNRPRTLNLLELVAYNQGFNTAKIAELKDQYGCLFYDRFCKKSIDDKFLELESCIDDIKYEIEKNLKGLIQNESLEVSKVRSSSGR